MMEEKNKVMFTNTTLYIFKEMDKLLFFREMDTVKNYFVLSKVKNIFSI